MIKLELPAGSRTYSALASLFKDLAGEEVPAPAPMKEVPAPAPMKEVPAPAPMKEVPAPAPERIAAAVFGAPEIAPPPNPVQLDANGLPWDHRIHASSRSKVSGGTWRYKRGVDADLVTQVEGELRGAMTVAPAELIPTSNVDTPPPATSFVELTQRITTNDISKKTLDEVLIKIGLPNFALLMSRPDLIPEVEAELFPDGV